MTIDDDPDAPVVRIADTAMGFGAVWLCLSRPVRPYREYDGDPTLDFPVTAQGEHVSLQASVRTWDGDGLDSFVTGLADSFAGWDGVRSWQSLESDLMLSAEHRSAGHVLLTWTLHGVPLENNWRFQTTTEHAAGEDMRNLAADINQFLEGQNVD